jgi:hypothetical protein
MESENFNEQLKKETAALFYNFNIKNSRTPITANIKLRNDEIKDLCSNMKTEIDKLYSSGNNNDKNFNLYRYYWTQYSTPDETSEKIIKKKKKKINLNSKIYFGSFLNQNIYCDIIENTKKYDKIKRKIIKSPNFSFVKNPKTLKYSKLPLDLYLSREDSSNLKGLISVKNIDPFNKASRNQSFSNSLFNNNALFTNTSSEEDDENISKIGKNKNNKIILINKNNENNESFERNDNKKDNYSTKSIRKVNSSNNSIKSIFLPLTKNNSSKLMSSQAIRMSQLDNFLNNSNNNFQKKNFSYSNLFRDNIINSNLNRVNKSYSHLLNHTFNKSFYVTQKDFLLKINEQLEKIRKYRTPKKDIKDLSEAVNIKCKSKIKNIKKLIKKKIVNNSNKKSIINLLTDYKKNKSKKKNNYYYNMKNQIRLLSIVDNMKNMTENSPKRLIEHLNEDYQKKSKKILKNDLFTKKINKIYKSFAEGKIINRKISSKNKFINKFASKNIMDLINLKAKYTQCDLLVKKIKEENSIIKNDVNSS